LGPVFGSVSESLYGFRVTQDMLAVTLLFFMLAYFFLCGTSDLIGFTKSSTVTSSVEDIKNPEHFFDTETQKNP